MANNNSLMLDNNKMMVLDGNFDIAPLVSNIENAMSYAITQHKMKVDVDKSLSTETSRTMGFAVNSNGMPVRAFVTSGTVADCKQADSLIDGIVAECLFGDRGYDTNEIVNYALKQGMQVVIPPKKNRVEQRDYDKYIYKLRHLVENTFLKLKHWRGIATRYAKNTTSFQGAVTLSSIVLWLRVIA